MKRNQRQDLIYRNLVPPQEANDTLAGITRKVVEHLAATNPAEWESGQWSAYLKLMTMRANGNLNYSPSNTLESLSSKDLKERLTNSDDQSNC